MSTIVTTDNEEVLGTAEAVTVKYDFPENPFSSSRPVEFELVDFKPSNTDIPAVYWMANYEATRDDYLELKREYDRRGKVIEQMTETFKAKKQRIHDYYAPQLENRKKEQEELEILSILFSELTYRYDRQASENAWRQRNSAESVDSSVVHQYEEQIDRLTGQVAAYSAASKRWQNRFFRLEDQNSTLRAQLTLTEIENKRIVDDANKFIGEFNKFAENVRAAADEWIDGGEA